MTTTTTNNPLTLYRVPLEDSALFRVYDLAHAKNRHLPEVNPDLIAWLKEFPEDLPRPGLRLRGKHAHALHGLCSELVLKILASLVTLEDPATTADAVEFRTLYEIRKAVDDLGRIAHALR